MSSFPDRVVVAGSAAAGKSCLTMRWHSGKWIECYVRLGTISF